MTILRLCVLSIAALICGSSANAQAGVYALFSGANLDPTGASSTRIYGPTFGMYANFPTPVVKFGGDVRGAFLNGSGTRNYYAVVGPRLEADLPIIGLKPYGEALVGGGDSISTATNKPTLHIDYELVAGVDRKFFTLLDWRILEFSYTRNIAGAGDIETKTLSTGLVLRIP
jgi:hypothetical protein